MRHTLFCMLSGILICTCLPLFGQRVIATVPVSIMPWGIGVNPVTKKV